MDRLFGSDILHTWVLGFVEAAVGFTLQIVKYIGHHNIDRNYSQSPKKLVEIIRRFPSHSSLQPMKKHVVYMDIYELFQSSNSQGVGNPMNTTGHLKLREANNLPSALLQIYFALSDREILPDGIHWSKNNGFSKPYFTPRQVVINAINAVIEVHWYMKAESLTETQMKTFQMLISNAQAHMLILDVVRKRIIHKAQSPKKEYVDLPVNTIGLMNNVKFELITHMVDAKRECGCDNSVRDTELGEMLMKMCKLLFADTNRRYNTVLRDMLLKYLHLQYMGIARKGLLDIDVHCLRMVQSNRVRNSSKFVCVTEERDVRTNSMYAQQCIRWCAQQGGYRTKQDLARWNVHPMILMVCNYKKQKLEHILIHIIVLCYSQLFNVCRNSYAGKCNKS